MSHGNDHYQEIREFLDSALISDDMYIPSIEFIKSNKVINSYGELKHGVLPGLKELMYKQRMKRYASETMLRNISEQFAHDGVKYAVIKGISFERAIYGELRFRDVGDIDMLVNAEDAEKAHELLLGMGYEQQLGPSSGSIDLADKAIFVARLSRQRTMATMGPVRKFPYKDAYCPYVMEGKPTVELHDGYRGLPEWYTREIVSRVGRDGLSLVQHIDDVLVLLIANAYENAESFYSNYYDDKLVLRDFLDLGCLLISRTDDIDQNASWNTVKELGLEDKAAIVLSDLNELFPGRFEGLADEIPKSPSLWGLPFTVRLRDCNKRKKAVLGVIRKGITNLAAKSIVGVRACSARGDKRDPYAGTTPTYELLIVEDGVKLVVYVGDEDPLAGGALAVCIYGAEGDGPPLCMRVVMKREGARAIAYLQECDKHPDGVFVWKEAGCRLQASYGEGRYEVYVPKDETHVFLDRGAKAITACVYDQHYECVYWARCRGKAVLTGNVPIGKTSRMVVEPVENICINFPLGRYVLSSAFGVLTKSLLDAFEDTLTGMPIDCDDRPVRSAIVRVDDDRGLSVIVEGECIAEGKDERQAISWIVQDMTDWCVSESAKNGIVAHAASSLVGDEAVLLMGSSGRGKTTLSLSMSGTWPIRGDECACIDTDSATSWTTPLPVNIKSGNEVAECLTLNAEGIECESPLHGKTFIYKRSVFRADDEPGRRRRIKAIVFPVYDKECGRPEISKMKEEGFTARILESIIGEKAPSVSFRDFVRMVSKYEIPLMQIHFCSAAEAAEMLIDRILDMENGYEI